MRFSVVSNIVVFFYLSETHNAYEHYLQSRHPGADWVAWHLPGGPVGPPGRWAATSNVEQLTQFTGEW